jgi:hypothetical protein
VTRYKCKSELYAADLTLDVNSSIYPLHVSGRYTMRLSMTLLPDVSLQKDEYDSVRRHLHHICCHIELLRLHEYQSNINSVPLRENHA